MRFETYVALRHLGAKQKSRAVNIITGVSGVGVCVGVTALIVVLSVMSGFDRLLRDAALGNRAHLTVSNRQHTPLDNPTDVMKQTEALCPEVMASGPFIKMEALLQSSLPSGQKIATGAYILGVDPQQEIHVTDVAENLTRTHERRYGAGSLPGDKEIVLGYLLADMLGVNIGDTVVAATMNRVPSPLGDTPLRLYLTVSGISEAIQTPEYDAKYSWVNLKTAAILSGRDSVDAIRCKLTDPFAAAAVSARIEKSLDYSVVPWFQEQKAYFGALKVEKAMMSIVLGFVTLVAVFSITSALIMKVIQKRRDIGILRTLGVSGSSVMLLFVVEGLFIGVGGTILGVISGTLLAMNISSIALPLARLLGVNTFKSGFFVESQVPVEIDPWSILWIAVAALILTAASTIYPAWRASRLEPIDALRHE